jgi:hypothetical protein
MFGRSRRNDNEGIFVPQFEPEGLLYINARSLRAFYKDDAPAKARTFADGYLLGIANATTVLLPNVSQGIKSNPAKWPSLERLRDSFIAYVDESTDHGEMPAGQAAMDIFMGTYLKPQG